MKSINIMKLRPLFYLISALLLFISIFSIISWGFKSSIDFKGGTAYEIKLPNTTDSDKVREVFKKNDLDISSLSVTVDKTYLLKFATISQDKKVELETGLKEIDKDFTSLRFETLGPSLGKELLQKTVYAIILSAIMLLIYIGSRFKDISFGAAAVIAMFHDSFILIGGFSLLGHFLGAELDTLFVTALLTTLSSSVHDTVVTFDRIRELKKQKFEIEWVSLANQAVTETIVRSINNSMTIIFMLFALVMLGGSTTRWFASALLIGVVCGTYSSIGVAVPLVLFFKKLKKK